MGSMFRAFYGRPDLLFAHLVANSIQVGTLGPSIAMQLLEARPERTFVARFVNRHFEALSAEGTKALLTEQMEARRGP